MATAEATTSNFQLPAEVPPVPSISGFESDSDDESFVVLDQLDSVLDFSIPETGTKIKEVLEASEKNAAEELARMSCSTFPSIPPIEVQPQETISMASINTLSADLSPEEIQKKVDSLIEENFQLKETIIHNNNFMKTQCERFLAWKNKREDVVELYKKLLSDAKEFIDNLKVENIALKTEFDKLNIKYNELIDDQKIKLEDKSNNVSVENAENLKAANNKIQELEKQIDVLKTENTNLTKNNATNDKIQELEKHIDLLRTENTDLIKNNTELRANVSKSKDQQAQYSKMEEYEGKILVLQDIIKKLQAELAEHKSANIKLQKDLNLQLDKLKTLTFESSEEIRILRQQLMNSQEKITEAECARNSMIFTLNAKEEEIAQLKKEMEKQKEKNEAATKCKYTEDEYYVLQTQSELYKADFEAERNAKEAFRTEKNQLAEDLQNLQLRNRELQEEVELLRMHGDFVYTPRNRHQQQQPSSPPPEEETTRRYKCPKCMFAFFSYEALNNHVHRCLDLNESLP